MESNQELTTIRHQYGISTDPVNQELIIKTYEAGLEIILTKSLLETALKSFGLK